jgi:proteasome lid subunit RPN8/RPN11
MENQRRPSGLEKFRSTTREECGLIVQNDEGHLYILKIENHATDPNDYVIHMSDVQRIEKLLSDDEKIIGFFHTHLPHHDCEPTDSDFEGAEIFPDMQNLIYKPSTKEVCWYGIQNDEVVTN